MRFLSTNGHPIVSLLPRIVAAAVLCLAAFIGSRASVSLLAMIIAAFATLLVLNKPVLGLLAMVPAALLVPIEFRTGSAVSLNLVVVLIPFLLGVWLLGMMLRRDFKLVSSVTTKPLWLFALAGLPALLVGNAYWDPSVPRDNTFTLVQLAQWALFVLSASAFWLTGNMVNQMVWLKRMTLLFLALGGGFAILFVIPTLGAYLFQTVLTETWIRIPFWILLTALALGQLLFNRELSMGWRLFLLVVLGAVLVFILYWQRETASNWVGVLAVVGMLAWLRWPKLRVLAIALLVGLAATGILSDAVYEFAGGDKEWAESGGSRLALIGRVLEVTMRNPITGLGPAAYRLYARVKPLQYGRALWLLPNVSSHNNYVDLFSHVGLLGLGLFFWFVTEVALLGLRLRRQFTEGFAAGYLNAMLASLVGALIIMLLADWMIPFVYNIGFPGFQASVLVWMFLGGLVTLEQMTDLYPER